MTPAARVTLDAALHRDGGPWLDPRALRLGDAELDPDGLDPDAVWSRATFTIVEAAKERPAGFVRVERTVAGLGIVTGYVSSWCRRRGVGVASLRFAASLPGVEALEVLVHRDNTAALVCCARAGLAATGRHIGDLLVLGCSVDRSAPDTSRHP